MLIDGFAVGRIDGAEHVDAQRAAHFAAFSGTGPHNCHTSGPGLAVHLLHAEVALEAAMLARFPAAEEDELAGYFRGYGADPETAARMATAVSQDPDTALRVHTREELGVDPNELPSPILAGVASLIAFSLGALIPLLPYLIGLNVLAATLIITAVALVTGGLVVGRLTGRSMLLSGVRQLALGALAIGVTYGVGSLIGSHAH